MDDTDAFFTLTIVGAPTTWMLGRRLSATQARAQGVRVDLDSGRVRLSRAWRDLALPGHEAGVDGRPRRRPGPAMRWLARHALPIAALGLAGLAASAIVLGVAAWA